MKNKFSHIVREKPFFLFLLPVFFVWHGYVEFYGLVSASKAFMMLLYFILGTIGVFLLSWLLFKQKRKAALYSFLIMCLYFFFGSIQDFLLKNFNTLSFTSYSFLLPALFAIFLFLFIRLRKTKNKLTKITNYLNILLLLLIVFDLVSYFKKTASNYSFLTKNKELTFNPCTGCPRPDVFLILTDAYPGKIPLLHYFQYNNSGFEDELKKRDFFIIDSSFSNYNYTLLSMGSLLNLDYLNLYPIEYNKKNVPVAFNAIRENRLAQFFENENYDIFNYSIFDIDRHPTSAKEILIDFDTNPIISQTFLFRLNKDVGQYIVKALNLNFLKIREKHLYDNLENNLIIDSLTRAISSTKKVQSKFVYTHLLMPHSPLYFDSLGKRLPDAIVRDTLTTNTYIGNLKFTNKKLLELIDYIQKNNSRPAIILLLGDHGFRKQDDTNKDEYKVMNLNAVYFPDHNYKGFYNGMSNVNEFRVVLNTQFGQHLDLLKDSITIFKP